jgi:hypothetical protein
VVAVAAAEVAKPPRLIHHIGRRRHRSQRTQQRIGDKIDAAFVAARPHFIYVQHLRSDNFHPIAAFLELERATGVALGAQTKADCVAEPDPAISSANGEVD